MSRLFYNRNDTRACQKDRRHQKAENLTPAERLKYGKPLRAKPGVRRLSEFSPDRERSGFDLEYVRFSNDRNHGS